MQLSSSVTKGDFAIKGREKSINTQYEKYGNVEVIDKEIDNSYRKMGEEILEEAKKRENQILLESMEKAKEIEKSAYEVGYNQGFTNGIEDGKKEANETIIKRAKDISREIIENSEEILKKATLDYNKYLLEKKDDIMDLAFSIAEKILKKEIENKENFIAMINSAIVDAKGEKTILIRCNSDDIEAISENIERWTLILGVKKGIFTIKDNLEKGEVIIETETGIIKLGIKTGLEKIKEELLERR